MYKDTQRHLDTNCIIHLLYEIITRLRLTSHLQVDNVDDANFYIDFGTEDHGDKYAFDGELGVLAHGFYPRKGEVRF